MKYFFEKDNCMFYEEVTFTQLPMNQQTQLKQTFGDRLFVFPMLFFMSMDIENYPLTQEGVIKLYLDWIHETRLIYVPKRKMIFEYIELEYSDITNTHGGVWRELQSCYHHTAIIQDELYKIINAINKVVNSTMVLSILSKRTNSADRIEEPAFKRFLKKYKSIDIDFDTIEHSGKFINCKNGVFDLNTMQFRSSVPEDYMCYNCPTFYNPKIDEQQLWSLFDTWFSGNIELQEWVLGILGSMLDRTILPKPILLFYSPDGLSGRSSFFRFLQYCLGPIINITQKWGDTSNHPYFSHSKNKNLKVVQWADEDYIPLFQAIDASINKITSEKGWSELDYMGSGKPVWFYTIYLPLFENSSTTIAALEVNELPQIPIHLNSPVHIIPFDYNASQHTSFLNLDKILGEKGKSMFLNLLIEYYQRWINGEIQEPYFLKKQAQEINPLSLN